MSKRDEISSTEKLLGVIRGEKAAPKKKDAQKGHAAPTVAERGSFLPKSVISFKKPVKVGVVVGHHDVTLAMISSAGDRRFRLLNFRKVKFGQDMGKDHPGFTRFLRKTLASFCANYQDIEVWSTIPSARVEIRFVQIPKVPDSQVANAVYWTYKKQVPFDEKDMIFDFELLGEMMSAGMRKIRALAYSAPRSETEEWKRRFARAGFPLSGISIVPFAVQNLFRTGVIQPDSENVCTLYIGRDWSRIDIFSKGNMALSRDIKTGLNSFVESIRAGIAAGDSGMDLFTGDTVESGAPVEKDGLDDSAGREEAKRLFERLLQADKRGTSREAQETTLEMVAPVMDRLVRQVERTLDHFTLHFDNASVGKLFLAGDISGENPLVAMMNEQFSHPIRHIDPFDSQELDIGSLRPPETIAEKDSFVPAIGVALSDITRTPNLNFTYRNKAIQTKIQRVNRIVFAAFFMLAVFCLGIFFWQGRLLKLKRVETQRLESRLERYSPQVDKEMIRQMAAKVKARQHVMLAYAQSYFGMAVITELSELTPDNIRLIGMDIHLRSGGKEKKKNKGSRTVMIEGIVKDIPDVRESQLALYILRLNGSKLFRSSTVIRQTVQQFDGNEVLRFSARLETI